MLFLVHTIDTDRMHAFNVFVKPFLEYACLLFGHRSIITWLVCQAAIHKTDCWIQATGSFEITSPPQEITCHMGSQCYLPPGYGDFPAFTQAEAGTRLSDPLGMLGWVELVVIISQDNLPAICRCLFQKWPGSVMSGNWAHDQKSHVQRFIQYTMHRASCVCSTFAFVICFLKTSYHIIILIGAS